MTVQKWKTVLKMAWPLIIANSFWNLQLTIDRIFLGMHSTEALGAAMAVMGVFWVSMALLQQTAGYITTFVAQYVGAKEEHKIGEAIWQSVFVSLVGGVAVLGLNFFSPWFFSIVGHSAQLQVLEVQYYNSVSYSALPTALVAVASGFFTGLGKTQVVIGINLVGLVANAVLDYLLIFGKFGFPEMGIAGAGYATAIATYLAAFYGFYLVWKSEPQNQYNLKNSIRLNFPLLKQFLKYGIPSGLQWALEGLAFTVFLMFIGRMPNGEAALSASSIAVTVMMLSILPSMGVAQAVMTLVGQKLGEALPNEAVSYTWAGVKITLVYILSIGSTFVFFPEFYLLWFKNEGNLQLWSQVQQIAPKILAIVAFFTILDSVYLNISFALKGAGDTRFVSAVALIVPWPLMVLPTSLLRPSEQGVVWAWGFAAIYAITITGILFWRFKQGRWKSMSVIR
jgi:MATE family multidrug resistance protein